jgi:conjugative transfer signal peptidase TraF
MMISCRKKTPFFLALLVLVVILGPLWRPSHILGFYNSTPSAPKGFYLIDSDREIAVGQYVILPVPEDVRPLVYGRGWLPEGIPLLKRVGAVAGDRVTISEEGLFINNHYFGPVQTRDQNDLPIPQLRGSFVIAPGYFLPISPYERSFDGRYFGPVPVGQITYQVKPFLTY